MGGIYIDTFQFDDGTPSLDEIINAIEKQSGLAVKIVSEIHDDTVHDWITNIAFSCKEDWQVQLSKDSKGAIELQAYLECEPTLIAMSSLALEALGGKHILKAKNESRTIFKSKYGTAISEEEYVLRCKKHDRGMKIMSLVSIALLVTIFSAIGFGVCLFVRMLIHLFQ